MDVGAWLRALGLSRYERAFRDAEVTFEVLPDVTDADLRELGLPLGPRRAVLKAIRNLADASVVPAEAGSTVARAVAQSAHALQQAERRQLTVVFIDLVGSTALSAGLDPEEMREVLRDYLDAVAAGIARFDGHTARFMGDGVLAYFGWPRAHEDDAERAVRAALDALEAVSGLRTPHGELLAARVGIATGLVVVGDLIGEGAAQEQAVVGDTPNLAARLQTLAQPGTMVVAPSTRRLLGELFEFVDLGPHVLKGIAEPVRAWRVRGPGRAVGRFEAREAMAGVAPLVGRDEELALLLRQWKVAQDGEGRVVLLSGEPGIGKSRLVHALREQLRSERLTSLRYQCSPYHVHSALWPVIEQLGRAADLARSQTADEKLDKLEALLSAAATDVADIAPVFAELLAIPAQTRYAPLELTPQQKKQRTFRALLIQLEGLAALGPVLIVLEDAHWIDPTTLELFELAIERLQRLPVLLIVTFRPEFNPPWTGSAHVSSLTLSNVSRQHALGMVENVTAGKALPPEVACQIVARTDGVPLFVEELTRMVLESGLLRDAGGRYVLAGPLPPLAIPATLQDSLLARLDRLAPVREVAQIAACIGREFSYELLAAVAAQSSEGLRQALADLVAAGLVFGHGAPPEARYTFKHALVQEAAYGSLLRSRRQEVHAQLARAIQERFPEIADAQPELVAHHLTHAGLAERAVTFWQKAGQLAIARSALVEAVAHLTQVLDLLEKLPDSADRLRRELELQVALGLAVGGTKGLASRQAERAWRRARELCDVLGEGTQLAHVLWGLCAFHVVRAEFARMREIGEELERLGEAQGDALLQSAGRRAIGTSLFYEGDLLSARRHLEHVLTLDSDVSFGAFVPIRTVALSHLSLVLAVSGRINQARVRIAEALAIARSSSHPVSIAYVHSYRFTVQELCGDPKAALADAETYLSISRKQGFSQFLGEATAFHGWTLAELGRPTDGVRLIRDDMAAMLTTRMRLSLPYYRALLADAYGRANRPKTERLRQLRKAIAQSERNRELWISAELYRRRGEVLASGVDRDMGAAEADLRRAIAVARSQGARLWELRAATSLGRLLRDRHARAEARDLLAPVCDWFTEGLHIPDLQNAKALLDELG